MTSTATPLPTRAAKPSEDAPRNLARWVWVPVMAVAVTWYFMGYVKSLDGYLAPIYERWPALQEWVARLPV